MIEPTNGTGLSGITGKSGKAAKNSLFAKLLLMLEKQTTHSGKVLQLIKSESGKANIAAAKSDKIDPAFLAKSELLLALAAKEKSAGKVQAEETATPLVSAVTIIKPELMNRMTLKDGAVSVLLSQQQGSAKGEQANPVLNLSLQIEGGAMTGKAGKTSGTQQSVKFGEALLTRQSETGVPVLANTAVDADQPLATFDKPQLFKHMAEESAGSQLFKHTDEESTGSQLFKRTAEVSANVQQFVQLGKPATGDQKPGALQAHASMQTNKLPVEQLDGRLKAETIQVATGSQPQQDKITQTLPGQNTAAITTQLNSSLGNQTEGRATAETIQLATGIQLQQGKSSQTAQEPLTTTASAISTAAAANISNSSLLDSGSQSSDKGSQDTHGLIMASGEEKTGGTATVTNFQSYVSQKASASMSVFDSMQYIAQSARKGQTRLEIQLEPANLGKIQISLQTDATRQLQIHLIVDQGATRQAIEQHLPALKSALAQQGLDLSGFSMGSHKDGTPFGSNARQQSSTFTDTSNSALADSTPATHALHAAGHGAGRLSIHV